MPTLDWIGKSKVINHHQEVPFRVLENQYTYGADDSENMIIHGDNLEALKALLPRYEGKVKCIYIDPPYNTGNEGWVYNDNVNDPKIRKWLGEVVGKEGEDLSRHDKWLCMMYPRLKLLQKLLADDGAIFISIDGNELYNLKSICDEIFGASCFVSTVSWQRTYSTRNDSKGIVSEVEHILVYSKKPGWNPNKLPRTAEMDSIYKNPDNDVTAWASDNPFAPDSVAHQGMVYAIQHPFTGEMLYPPSRRHWTFGQEQILDYMKEWCPYKLSNLHDEKERAEICGISEDAVRKDVLGIVLDIPLDVAAEKAKAIYERGQWPKFYFTNGGKGGIRRKTYINSVGGKPPTNLWQYSDVGHTDEASKTLKAIFEGKATFETPKPARLIERILQIAGDKDTLILDSFAGSGTTAHAVLNMNKADGGHRKFILVEMMDYADSITAERVKRVIDGYKTDRETVLYDEEITEKNLVRGADMLEEAKATAKEAKEKYSSVKKPKVEAGHLRVVAVDKAKDMVAGTGGDFSYYELGEPLLFPDGNLNETVGVEKIREYIWYTETKTAYVPGAGDGGYYLGRHGDTGYYFYYEPDQLTILNHAFLPSISEKTGGYVVYADRCALSNAELAEYGIIFKKIPRDITKI